MYHICSSNFVSETQMYTYMCVCIYIYIYIYIYTHIYIQVGGKEGGRESERVIWISHVCIYNLCTEIVFAYSILGKQSAN